MADLLANLETGMSPNVGAASRLREHISNIDHYMSTQSQNDQTSQLPYNEYNLAVNMIKGEPELGLPNPNIDPTLQSTGLPDAGVINGFQNPANLFEFSNVDSIGMTGVMNGIGAHSLQLPPELMNFPWGTDLGSGFIPPSSGQF